MGEGRDRAWEFVFVYDWRAQHSTIVRAVQQRILGMGALFRDQINKRSVSIDNFLIDKCENVGEMRAGRHRSIHGGFRNNISMVIISGQCVDR